MTKVLKASTSQTKFIQAQTKFMEVQAKFIEDIVDKDKYDKISANSRSRKLENQFIPQNTMSRFMTFRVW